MKGGGLADARQKYAEPLLSKVGWAYYASAGDDEISMFFPPQSLDEAHM